MSNSTGTQSGAGGTTGDGARPPLPPAAGNAAEAYAFACMNCGHGWEQAYEIEHHTDTAGRPYVTYLADGRRVPSPLTRPTCDNCDGHLVRIMRAGQVSAAVASRWSAAHTERGVPRPPRHWPALHFLRRKPAAVGPEGDSTPSRRLTP